MHTQSRDANNILQFTICWHIMLERSLEAHQHASRALRSFCLCWPWLEFSFFPQKKIKIKITLKKMYAISFVAVAWKKNSFSINDWWLFRVIPVSIYSARNVCCSSSPLALFSATHKTHIIIHLYRILRCQCKESTARRTPSKPVVWIDVKIWLL